MGDKNKKHLHQKGGRGTATTENDGERRVVQDPVDLQFWAWAAKAEGGTTSIQWTKETQFKARKGQYLVEEKKTEEWLENAGFFGGT